LSAAEQASKEELFEAHRKALQARNIRDIEKVLAKSKISASDRSTVKELRDEAAKLRDTGKLANADRALRRAWKMLAHPELFVFTARVMC
jgi:rRNA maturation endonuclease Nob1